MASSPPGSPPEPAVAAGDDLDSFATVLGAVYDAAMSGGRLPARPREVIRDSWSRAQSAGVDPDRGADVAVLDRRELDERRRASALLGLLEQITAGVSGVVDDGQSLLVVADAQSRVLWRQGDRRLLAHADRLGFVEGADWAETAVGTNAIGTVLGSGRSVQVFSAEHFVRTHHPWSCVGAPIRDPSSGEVLGVIDLSGPAAAAHPAMVGLVDAVARLAGATLQQAHHARLAALRAVGAPLLPGAGAASAVVDHEGAVAAVWGVDARPRLTLPSAPTPGRHPIPELGWCELDPLPGGWLVRVIDASGPVGLTTVCLDLAGPARVTVRGSAGEWSITPSPRHADILVALAAHPDGLTAADLAGILFADRGRTVTVRAEMVRLRKRLGGLLVAPPYRFAPGVEVTRRAALPTPHPHPAPGG